MIESLCSCWFPTPVIRHPVWPPHAVPTAVAWLQVTAAAAVACIYFTTAAVAPLRRYALVSYDNGELVVEREELMEHTLQLHEGLGRGDVVEVLDTWCDASYPGSVLASRAFTKVG